MQPRKVIVEPSHPKWTSIFEEEKKRLERAFEGLPIQFYHIGSTSIAGCDAKPILDILGVTPDILLVDRYNPALQQLDYTPKGEFGIKQRRFFQRIRPLPVNLHVFEDTDPEGERHLRFCAYLRAHPEKKAEYSRLKRTLAEKFPDDGQNYCLGKEAFIKEIDRNAAWASTHYTPPSTFPRKKEWLPHEISKAMEVNRHLAFTYFAKYISSSEILFEPDITIVRSILPFDAFNYVFAAEWTEQNACTRVRHVLKYFERPPLPLWWWLSEQDTPSHLDQILESEGLLLKGTTLGMYAFLDSLSDARAAPPGFVIERVMLTKHLVEFAQVMEVLEECSNTFDLYYSKIPPFLYQEGAPYEMYVGYEGQVPVSIGVAVFHAHTVGIYQLATLPSYRKKGYGSALLQFLLKRGIAKGYHLSTLQASEQGRDLYERFGFRPCCTFKEYVKII